MVCAKCSKEYLLRVIKRGRQNVQYASLHVINGVDDYLFIQDDTLLERERQTLKLLLIQMYQSLDYLLREIEPPDWVFI